ncbi:hypothetical protein D3C71_1897860 [compost metagenome]
MRTLLNQEQLRLQIIQKDIQKAARTHPQIADRLNGERDLLPVMQLEQLLRLFLNLCRISFVVGLLG